MIEEMLHGAELKLGALASSAGEHEFLADLRYVGQSNTLPIVLTKDTTPQSLRKQFDTTHIASYGYSCPELSAFWVQLRAHSVSPRTQPKIPQDCLPPPSIEGPTTLIAQGSTVYIPTGWNAKRLKSGGIISTRSDQSPPASDGEVVAQLEIHRHRLSTIAEEMGETLRKASFSANIKERLDYSCALFDGHGHLLCHAAHIPDHLGSTGLSVRSAMQVHHFRPGDTVVVNDPFCGGTHLPDVTLVTSVHLSGSESPDFYVANRAHHSDVGGEVSGVSAPSRRRMALFECSQSTRKAFGCPHSSE